MSSICETIIYFINKLTAILCFSLVHYFVRKIHYDVWGRGVKNSNKIL